jgi:hypothetical protein
MSAKTVFKIVGWGLLGTCLVAALVFVAAIPVMALWNWVMPVISKGAVGELTYLQAVGFYIMCHLLFKSHHKEFDHDKKKRNQPRLLARKIHGLLGEDKAGDCPAENG